MLSRQLAAALAARFREVLVDESQDCNPEDLQIIQWLRDAGIVTKVVCDPHQSIYSFRNGITAEDLVRLSDSFDETDRLAMTGNFRSSQNICHAVCSLRPPGSQHPPLTAAGIHRDDPSPVYVLAYQGTTVTFCYRRTVSTVANSETWIRTSAQFWPQPSRVLPMQ